MQYNETVMRFLGDFRVGDRIAIEVAREASGECHGQTEQQGEGLSNCQ